MNRYLKEERQKLISMLDKLTKRQKEAMHLRYFHELNCDEIAMIMQLSKQAVYNLIPSIALLLSSRKFHEFNASDDRRYSTATSPFQSK